MGRNPEPSPARPATSFPPLFFIFTLPNPGPTQPACGPGKAQWPAPDEPSSSSPQRPRRRTRAACPCVKKSSRNQIKTEPRSNPTTLRDRVSIAHIKDPKSPINRTPSRQILAQNRAQTLEAPVVPPPHRCKPSLVGPVPRPPSTTSTTPTWSVPDDIRSLEPSPAIVQSRSLSRVVKCRVSVPPPLKNDPGELPAPLWPCRTKTRRVPLYGGPSSNGATTVFRPRRCRRWPGPLRAAWSEMNVRD
jgi:hypothetical protein